MVEGKEDKYLLVNKIIGLSTDDLIRVAIPLDRSFYDRNAVKVARDLLGSILVHEIDGELLAGFIVESEAYRDNEPACHAFRGKTRRTEIMFGPGGYAYIYFVYGVYWCLNATVEKEGNGAACLIRAVEPFLGIDHMRNRRQKEKITDLCSGPGKLTVAFNLTGGQNGYDLSNSSLRILALPDDIKPPFRVRKSSRVGISMAQELQYRYFVESNPCVSKHNTGTTKRKNC